MKSETPSFRTDSFNCPFAHLQIKQGSKDVITVADTLRITGNNAVHPGTMDEKDFDDVAEKMFSLLNFIINYTPPLQLCYIKQVSQNASRSHRKRGQPYGYLQQYHR